MTIELRRYTDALHKPPKPDVEFHVELGYRKIGGLYLSNLTQVENQNLKIIMDGNTNKIKSCEVIK